MTREEVVAKARDLMAPVLGDAQCAKLIESILGLENVKDVRSCGLYFSEPDLASLLFSWTRIGIPFSCDSDAPCCNGLRSGFW